jgi:hypothetical protein
MIEDTYTICAQLKAKNGTTNCIRARTFMTQHNQKLIEKSETLQHLMEATNRRKRWLDQGIAPGLSVVLKWLIGTPDAYDKESYDEALSGALHDNKIAHKLTSQQIQVTQASLAYVNHSVNTLFQNEVVFQTNWNHLSNVVHGLGIKTQKNYLLAVINEHEQFIENLIEKTIIELDEIINAILFAKRNILHPSLITPKILASELAQAHIPVDKKFPFKTTYREIYKFLDLCKIHAFLTPQENLVFTIRIPLLNSEQYTFYHLHPFPTPSPSSPMMYHYIEAPYEFVAVNQRITRMLYIPTEDVCLELDKRVYMCHVNEIHYSATRDECIPALLTSTDVISPPPDCKILSLYARFSVFHKLQADQWLFLCTNKTHVAVDCPYEKRMQDLTLQDHGILSLQHGCRAYTPIGTLIAESEENQTLTIDTSRFNFRFFDEIATPNFSATQLPPVHLTQLDFNQFRSVSEKFEEYEKIMQQQEEGHKLREKTNYIQYAVYGLLTFVILYLFAKFRRCLFDYYTCCCKDQSTPDLAIAEIPLHHVEQRLQHRPLPRLP